MLIRNKRLIRTRDFEFYEIAYNGEQTLGYLASIDTRRPSQLTDFPELVGIETEESFDENANHIKVFIFKLNPMEKSHLESKYLFIEDLIGFKVDCSYHVSEYEINTILEFDFPDHILEIVKFVNGLFSSIKEDFYLSNISEKSFNYLSQE